MKKQRNCVRSYLSRGLFLFLSLSISTIAYGLELDWSGQFWAEYNFIYDYTMDTSAQGSSVDPNRVNKGGYYVPSAGNNEATFQNLFLRLRPGIIVNDNIYLKSEIWFGDPIFGIFGNAVPYTVDQRQFYSNQSRGSTVSAQRFWGELVTDIGTFQIGRVPLDWGLGVVWNKGDSLWSRYVSTGDAIRWIAKFGSFSFIPSFILPSTGNTIGGACYASAAGCTPGTGSGGVTDYSLVLKYENPDDEIEAGINIIRRLGGSGQDTNGGLITPNTPLAATQPQTYLTGAMNFMTYDLFVKKNIDTLTLSAEVPIVTGNIGPNTYQTLALAAEADWRATDTFNFLLKSGYAPGQASSGSTDLGTFRSFFFNPNYHIAMIMFNYQLGNFAGPQTLNSSAQSQNQLRSPYDNPIVNATYVSLATKIHASSKWTIKPAIVYAHAPQTAQVGQNFFNYWTRTVQTNNGTQQGNSLGWEFDLGVTFQWDENFLFSFDNGLFLPGNFYAFSNTATQNSLSPVFASSIRVGISF